MAKDNKTKPIATSINKNNISIIGDNVLYNNGIITAFYLLPLTNYSTASAGGIEGTVDDLNNLITNLTTTNPDLCFTIERIEKVIRKKDVLRNLIDTVKIYREEYDMPIQFTKNIKDDVQEYCILGIDIQQSNLTDVEDLTIKDTIKAMFKQFANAFAGLGNMKCDPEVILKMEDNIFKTINSRCVRCSKDLVFYNFVSKVYPCYEISYDKLSYINENSYEDIMCSVAQSVSDNFGWFEMHNEGIEVFGLPSETTYGCMLQVHQFPPYIDNVNFPMDYPNVTTTVQCLKKDKANIDIKRIRGADRYELDQGIETGAPIEQLSPVEQNIRIATRALQDLDSGEVMCQFNTTILVYANTREELKQRTMTVITSCKNRTILVSKSLTQGLAFLDNYINKKPKKYMHMANVRFPLSFQQNYGATVGDTFTKVDDIWSPSIGVDM